MTVKQLVQKLGYFDQDRDIGGSGHYGELLNIEKLYNSPDGFVVIQIEDPGSYPDVIESRLDLS